METTLLTPLTRGQVPQSYRGIPQRYRKSWSYKDKDSVYFLGTFKPVSISPHATDILYFVEAGDIARPDLISYKFYRTTELYWVILWINGISDPFEGIFPGMLLRVPTLERLALYGIFNRK